MISVLNHLKTERFHNFIVNIFDMVLESDPMLPPHAFAQLELNLFLKVASHIRSHVYISLKPSKVSVLSQVHNCYVVISFVSHIAH